MLESIIEWQALQNPDRTAIWTDRGAVTYRRLARDVAALTTALAREGLPPGVVLIGKVPSPIHWLLTLALERLGRTTVSDQTRIQEGIALIRPAVVIIGDEQGLDTQGARVLRADMTWLREALKAPPGVRLSPPDPNDVVRIVLSSGTTGGRKPVPIMRRVMDARIPCPFAPPGVDIKFLLALGLETIGAFTRPLAVWYYGGTVMIPGVVDRRTFLQKPTLMTAAPVSLPTLLPMLEGLYSPSDPLRIRAVGSAVPPPLLQEVLARPDLELTLSYGSSEAGMIASGPASLAADRPGAVGYPCPWVQIQIVDEQGRSLPRGESGIVRIRGDGVVSAPGEEWFHPNDVGHFVHNGVLVIDGRRDDVVNLGGSKVSSARVEETLLSCKGVMDAAVAAFPMSNGRWALHAAVVSSDGYDAEALRQAVLSAHEVGVTLVDVAEIPRNAMGKIVRQAVKQAILAKSNTQTKTA